MRIICENCGAACEDAKDMKRFQRRHPKKCKSHAKFMAGLASGTKSVDYDETQGDQTPPEEREL